MPAEHYHSSEEYGFEMENKWPMRAVIECAEKFGISYQKINITKRDLGYGADGTVEIHGPENAFYIYGGKNVRLIEDAIANTQRDFSDFWLKPSMQFVAYQRQCEFVSMLLDTFDEKLHE